MKLGNNWPNRYSYMPWYIEPALRAAKFRMYDFMPLFLATRATCWNIADFPAPGGAKISAPLFLRDVTRTITFAMMSDLPM